jgi:hypothetical protein
LLNNRQRLAFINLKTAKATEITVLISPLGSCRQGDRMSGDCSNVDPTWGREITSTSDPGGYSVESQHQLAFGCLWHRAFDDMVG